MKNLVLGKEYYVDAAHLRAAVLTQDKHRYMQNIDDLRRSEGILAIKDAGNNLKSVEVIPATVCKIVTDSAIGETQVTVRVDFEPLETPILVVVNPDKIYKEVSKPETVKKVDNGLTWYCKCNFNPYDYTPKRIIYNNPATIVFWRDGTKTVVKKNEKEKYNSYNAFCAALAKKIFGTNSEVNRIVRSGYNQKVAEGQKKLAEFKKKVEKARKARKKGEKK